MGKLSHKKLLKDQLHQVFEYAEIMCRLNQAQELLNPKGGYLGEQDVFKGINELKNEVYDNFRKHFSNSKVSEQALDLLDEFRSIMIGERTGAKYKIGDEVHDRFGYYEVIAILENEYANEDVEKLVYVTKYSGHDGVSYSLEIESYLNQVEEEHRKS